MAWHLPNLARRRHELEFAAVNRLAAEPLAAIRDRYGFELASEDFRDVIAAGIDICVISSSTALHYDVENRVNQILDLHPIEVTQPDNGHLSLGDKNQAALETNVCTLVGDTLLATSLPEKPGQPNFWPVSIPGRDSWTPHDVTR